MKEIITKDQPKWDTFCDELAKAVNFREDEKGSWSWNCDHDLRMSIKILHDMVLAGDDEIDVAGTLEYFRENGGHCDCEVLFNVEGD